MAQTVKRPPTTLTVGDQYICFAKVNKDGNFDFNYDEEVLEYPTVTTVDVSDNTDSYESYASGKIYDTDAPVISKEISTTNIAFDTQTLEKMKGSEIDGGAILSGGYSTRPYFAYGVDIINKDGTHEFRWYPKCKLTDNDDSAETSEESHKDQTKALTIKAYGFDDDGHVEAKCLTGTVGYEKVTAETFFTKPLTSLADIKKLSTSVGA